MDNNPWTNHEVAEMLRLLRLGKTRSTVGKIMKRTRNSITGQCAQVIKHTVYDWNAVKALARLG